jgi:outer membrane protein
MNTFGRFFAIGIICMMSTLNGQELMAQNQKTGYIDSEYILTKLPDYSGVEQRLATIVQGWATEIDNMEKEIQELKRDLQAKEILYTPQVRKDKQDEIDRKIADKDRLVQSKYGPDGEYYKTQETLLEPIQQKIMIAVRTVAERGNYDFVFDRAGDFLFLYTKPQWNLSNDVLKELGIEVDTTTGQ